MCNANLASVETRSQQSLLTVLDHVKPPLRIRVRQHVEFGALLLALCMTAAPCFPISQLALRPKAARKGKFGYCCLQELRADLLHMTGVQQALELQRAQDGAHLDAFHARSLQRGAPQSGPSERVRAAYDR